LLSLARLIDLPLIQKKAPRTSKNRVPRLRDPVAAVGTRSAKTPLAEQIRKCISAAIESGVFAPGARLPSWLDLAAQLGVARGTVRSAYEKLSAAQLIVASRATGTRVADRPPITDASSHLHAPSTALQIAGAARPQQFGP
jgi:GntR family transcriptional regulator / MocR family aminotransferase